MTDVIRALQLTQMENDLLDITFQIRKNEGIINSPNIKSEKYKKQCKVKLVDLFKEKNRLTAKITEAVLLDMEI